MSPEFRDKSDIFLTPLRREITAFSEELSRPALETEASSYASIPREAISAQYAEFGKGIRGMLMRCGYELMGGGNEQMIAQAGAVIELLHTHVLAFDDIEDSADLRRGKPSLHKVMEQTALDYGWQGDIEKIGSDLASLGSLSASSFARVMFYRLDAPDDRKISALEIIDTVLGITVDGQIDDYLLGQDYNNLKKSSINSVMLRKTGYYTILAPLQIGMVLAGASEADLKKVEKFALNLGIAFQISDDCLPYMSSESGKDDMSDIKEGKATLIIYYALELCSDEDRNFILSCLRNKDLPQEDFEKCVQIIKRSGAVDASLEEARQATEKALAEISHFPKDWDPSIVGYLQDMARFVFERKK